MCDKIAAGDKENRKEKHSGAKPEGCNATSRSNNKTPKKLKADTSKNRFVSSADIDEIIKNAESRKTKYQTKWAVSTFNGMYKAQFTEFQLELQHIICNTYYTNINSLKNVKQFHVNKRHIYLFQNGVPSVEFLPNLRRWMSAS